MNPFLKKIFPLFCFVSVASALCFGQAAEQRGQSRRAKLDVSELKSVPDGNYLVTLELGGQQRRLNIKVQGNKAKCVNSSDPALKDIEGQFEVKGNGAFVGFFHGGTFRATQVWIFRNDGAAAIREVPDRGEQQSALPVDSDSVEPPKQK
jgi:hypothetical protein